MFAGITLIGWQNTGSETLLSDTRSLLSGRKKINTSLEFLCPLKDFDGRTGVREGHQCSLEHRSETC